MGAIREGILTGTDMRAPRSAAALSAALRDAREYTLGLYAHLDDDQQRFPRIATVNPPRWEIGHVGWFQEFWCRRHATDHPRGVRTPSRLASADAWFDSTNVPHAIRWDLPLPGWDGIHAYLAATLDDTLEALARSDDGERYFFELALYHEDMHGEALVMSLQSLALPAPRVLLRRAHARRRGGDVLVDGGRYVIGTDAREAATRFVFDNERAAHRVDVAAFAIARQCVTEIEFAAFVDDGGYAQTALWPGAGLDWLRAASRHAPAYWRRDRTGWQVRRFDGWHAPEATRAVVHVNAYEAEAWCAWAGRRLPTEVEWEVAALQGAFDIPADVWQWTSTAFAPYPGFAPDPYEAYSAPWFHDHRVLRGGSVHTHPRLVHERFRNFYRPERHDAFAGFRTCSR